VLLYLRVQQRRRASAVSFERFGVRGERHTQPGFRRHVPPLIFLLGLLLLLVALARPQAEINLPRVEGTVILVFDVSGSMAAADVEPSRIEAAKQRATEFIQSQPESIKIGIVTFSGNGFTVQSPTNDQNKLLTAINRLEPQTGTSLGQGILVALNTLAVDAGYEPVALATPDSSGAGQEDLGFGSSGEALLERLPDGPYPPSVIVLLSDGENNQSIDPIAVAQAAADRSVRIDALGFGTAAGTTIDIDGFKVHTMLNEAVLQDIVTVAGGAYYNPEAAQDPQDIYKNLTPKLVVKPESMEITSIFTAASIFMLLLGVLFSVVWFARMP
jgi:Ca-activated chloride channel family protein